ncbi:MAG: chemotaxis protein CheA [Vampirovibrionales bacterium]
MSMTDDALLQEFLTESLEHLASIEPDLLVLEEQGSAASDDVINKIFRAIHSIKGAAGFFGFDALTHFSHLMESVFMKIRDKVLDPQPHVVDVLLKGVDRLTEMVEDIHQSHQVPIATEESQLKAILDGRFSAELPPAQDETPGTAEGVTQSVGFAFDLTTERVRNALNEGCFLYHVTVHPAVDFATTEPEAFWASLQSAGRVLAGEFSSDPGLATEAYPEAFVLLYGTVLEPELALVALPIEASRVTPVPVENVLENALSSSLAVDWLDEALQPLVQGAQQAGQFVYGVTVHSAVDFESVGGATGFFDKLNQVGKIIWGLEPVDAFTGSDSVPQTGYFLFSTVLDPDLAPTAIPVPASQLHVYGVPAQQSPEPEVLEAVAGVDNTGTTAELSESVPSASKEQPKESRSGASASSNAANETIRVRVDLLNRLMNLAGEMVLFRNQLNQKLEQYVANIEGLGGVVQNINATTSELQEYIMQTRMQPIGNVFNKFNRVVRDIARSLDKQITIEISGDEVELDKSIVESLSDPLTHLIRNACDHGIELPAARKKSGKSPQGTIQLKAFQEGGQIVISIQDDGKGIDADSLAQKALEKGIIKPSDMERMSSKEKVNLIFHPGFSTAAQVSDISGRGVGMDVVRTNIEKLGGTIDVETEVGMGTIIYLHLPLTLAIIPSLLVGVQQHRFAVPQINVVELLCVRGEDVPKQIERVGDAAVLKLRGRLLPLVRLADALGLERTFSDPETGEAVSERRLSLYERRLRMSHPEVLATEDGRVMLPRTGDDRREVAYPDYNIAVLKMGGKQYGLIVDEVHNLEEIVVKPLSQYVADCRCFAGATIMGDGSVAMILDVAGVADTVNLDFSRADKEQEDRERALQLQNKTNTTRMEVILFSNGHQEDSDQFAVPLQHVLRLEKFDTRTIQHVGGKEFLTYQGRSLPLLRLHHEIPVEEGQADETGNAYLLLPRAAEGHAALVVNRIVDVDTVEVSS